MSATEAADKSASAAAASSSSTGFDLINHAIRMGSVSANPVIDSESSKAAARSELLLKAHLLDQQQRGIPISAAGAATPISRVSSAASTVTSSLGSLISSHSHASDMAAAAAAAQHHLVRQQLGGGGIVAALQRRHRQNSGLSLSELPVSAAGLQLQQHLASYLGAAAAPGTHSPVPPGIPTKDSAKYGPSATTSVAKDSRNTQDEQNARQLNPNAFQFPWKLHDMLDRSSNEGNEDIVSWVDNGEAFRVHLPDVFVESIMPRFFKQTKYKSFQRQLNLYGFTRLHNGPNKGGYKHKYFRQGQRTLCQLITRCPIRDSSAAATAMAAAAANEESVVDRLSISNSGNSARMMMEQDPSATLPHAASSVSVSSKASATSLKQNQQASDAVLLSPHHTAILAARQQALANSFQIMEKARQEQQLQQLQLQQFESQRLQQLKLHQQQQREQLPLTSSYVPGMPLAGTDHSTYPSASSRQLSVSRSSGVSPALESAKARVTGSSPHHVLDASNTSSLESHDASPVTPNSSKLSDKEKMSMFHKEFQFPWKLYEMLERSDQDDFSRMVSWMPGDSSFKVHDADNFVKLVMPRFFKQTKYKSFQRQLNLYGFIRVDTGPNKGGYRHPNFIKGRKDLLAMINRIKIKGNGRPRSDRGNGTPVVIDTDCSEKSYEKQTKPAAPSTVVSNPENISGIAVILEAIKAKEGKESAATEAPPASTVPTTSNVVHDVADSNSDDSNSTIPSTIDVQMKESSDMKSGCGLSWRQHPSESFSDWTIEVLEEDITKAQQTSEVSVYHVHRRVLAVGPKKSDYFANIFKSNGSANRSQLRLNKKQAAVFPMALDYIYADTDFDLDTEKAYALYSLGERLENASIVQTVTDFYCKWCMTKENVVEFLKLGKSFQNKSLLEAAVLKCSQEIWFMDVESASKIDPGLLLRILVIATTVARNRDTPEYDSLKLSQMVALSVSNATTVTLTLEIFRSLTASMVLPSLEPIAAIKLLATESTLLSVEGSSMAGDKSLHERCIASVHKNWEMVRKQLSESTELANAMRSISSIVLFDLLMKTTKSQESESESTDMII